MKKLAAVPLSKEVNAISEHVPTGNFLFKMMADFVYKIKIRTEVLSHGI
jgi:hypothetical protein